MTPRHSSTSPASDAPVRREAADPPGAAGDDPVEALRRELEAARRREAELRGLLRDAHRQLAERDEELVRSALAHRRVEEMRRTRLWRMGTAYWRTRDRVRRRLTRTAPPR